MNVEEVRKKLIARMELLMSEGRSSFESAKICEQRGREALSEADGVRFALETLKDAT